MGRVARAQLRCCVRFSCLNASVRSRVMTAGLPKANEIGRRPRAEEGMSESRQLSVVKRRHMAALVTVSFLLYSTVSTIVFQVR